MGGESKWGQLELTPFAMQDRQRQKIAPTLSNAVGMLSVIFTFRWIGRVCFQKEGGCSVPITAVS